jgi:hypothetical protein
MRQIPTTARYAAISNENGPDTPRPQEPIEPDPSPQPDPRDPPPFPRYEDVPPTRPIDLDRSGLHGTLMKG